jgi:hypothetical protein
MEHQDAVLEVLNRIAVAVEKIAANTSPDVVEALMVRALKTHEIRVKEAHVEALMRCAKDEAAQAEQGGGQ